MKINELIKNSEYVLKGHPDKLCDGVAETIAMAIYNIDGWNGRSAVEILYTGNQFMVGGEFDTTLEDWQLENVIEFIVRTIIGKQTYEHTYVRHIWQNQSPEINEASLKGLGDNTIAYGYYNYETGTNKTPAHLKLKEIGDKIEYEHSKALADGKLINFNNEITISIEDGIHDYILHELGITNPTIFKKSGSNADSGVVGRKLIAERHGNGIPHGGGAFTGKDFTKGDKSLKLIGDHLAKQHFDIALDDNMLVQLSCKYGAEDFNVTLPNGNTQVESFSKWKHYMVQLYKKYAPVKPSDYLTRIEIEMLEDLIKSFTNKELENPLW